MQTSQKNTISKTTRVRCLKCCFRFDVFFEFCEILMFHILLFCQRLFSDPLYF